MFKKVKSILALSIAAALCAVSIPSVMAAESATDEYGRPIVINGTYDDPAQAAITKILQMPYGTNIPDATFNFSVTPVTVDDVDNDGTNMPAIDTVSLAFDGGQTLIDPPLGDFDSYYLESGNIFEGVQWPHSGVYVYEVAELQNTNDAIDANTDHESLTYSQALYELTAYVKDGADGYYIAAITDVVSSTDDTANLMAQLAGPFGPIGIHLPRQPFLPAAANVGDKVDPTPGGNEDSGSVYSDMTFTNIYVKTNGAQDPEDPDPTAPADATLSVSKAVVGALADTNQYFDFSMTVTAPSLVFNVPDFYRAYVVQDGQVVTSEDNADPSLIGSDNGGSFIKFLPSVDTPFNLKAGQKLVFIDTPVGTWYDVSEINPTNYLASLLITSDNSTAPVIEAANAGDSIEVTNQLVGEHTNTAAFTNNRDMLAPTGLKISDLPFIGLIALALASLTVFVVAKSRRKKAYNR